MSAAVKKRNINTKKISTGYGEASYSVPVVENPCVERLIKQLLTGREKAHGRDVPLKDFIADIFQVMKLAKRLFMSQPMLLELSAPVIIVGDIHGQFKDLLRLFEIGGYPPKTNYLFLGDYVDRSRQSVEVIVLLLCYKLKYPYNFFLLMGNHEDWKVNALYGFKQECRDKFEKGEKLWKEFNDVFCRMPVAAVVADKIFCAHGGISKSIVEGNIELINEIKRPIRDVGDDPLLTDILWSDPRENKKGFHFNHDRAVSVFYGHDKIYEFLDLENNGLELICRAHECVEFGYEFQADMKLVTVFSAPNYTKEFDNAAAILESQTVHKALKQSSVLLKHIIKMSHFIVFKLLETINIVNSRTVASRLLRLVKYINEKAPSATISPSEIHQVNDDRELKHGRVLSVSPLQLSS